MDSTKKEIYNLVLQKDLEEHISINYLNLLRRELFVNRKDTTQSTIQLHK
jgi:hypothetical protein